MSTHYNTPQDAEDAFYDAFEAANLEAMQTVWARADNVICIFPLSPVFQGHSQVMQGWEHVLGQETKMSVMVHHKEWIEQDNLAIHVVEEEIVPEGTQQPKMPPLIATNIYRRTDSGWQMILHHASPPPPPIQPGMGSSF